MKLKYLVIAAFIVSWKVDRISDYGSIRPKCDEKYEQKLRDYADIYVCPRFDTKSMTKEFSSIAEADDFIKNAPKEDTTKPYAYRVYDFKVFKEAK